MVLVHTASLTGLAGWTVCRHPACRSHAVSNLPSSRLSWVESDFETSMYVHSVLSHDLP